MKVEKLIIHCSATPEGKDFSVKDIDRWHRQKGWDGCGYHYVIRLDGTIEEGRPCTERGAHCLGENSRSLGICYIGGLAPDGKTPRDTRTPAQKAALWTLIKKLRQRYGLQLPVYGHRDFAPKACPSFDAKAEYN